MAVVIAFGLITLFLSSQYGEAAYAPALFFNRNTGISNAAVSSAALKSLEITGASIVQIGAAKLGYLFVLQNVSSNSMTYIIATPMLSPAQGETVAGYNSISREHAYMMRNGVTLKSAVERSGNLSFDVNYFALPYDFNNSYIAVNRSS